jgi:hypothetical protein
MRDFLAGVGVPRLDGDVVRRKRLHPVGDESRRPIKRTGNRDILDGKGGRILMSVVVTLLYWALLPPQGSPAPQSSAASDSPSDRPAATIGRPICLDTILASPPRGWPSGVAFPHHSCCWELIGDFTLKNGDMAQQVKLYLHDMCSLDNFLAKQFGEVGGVGMDPNCLFLEVVFQDPRAAWHHKRLNSMSRTEFSGIRKSSDREVTLEFRGNDHVEIFLEQWFPGLPEHARHPSKEIMDSVAEANKPWLLTVVLNNGEPVIKK